MPRGRSGNMSEISNEDLEGFADSELEKLQRKYRIMEGDRQAYTLESQDVIRKQLAEIDKLQSERGELLKNLTLAESKFNQEKDRENIMDLQKLLIEKDDCAHEIEEEKKVQANLDEQIKLWEQKVRDQRQKVGGTHGNRSLAQKTQKRMSVLEGRLHRALSKFNMALTKNADMRNQIETLRIEKGRFQQLYKRLEKELRDLKREIGQVIEASTLAYDQRDEAQNKIVLLKEKSDKDLHQFNAEIKELHRIVDHDRILRDFMNAKGVARISAQGLQSKDKELKKRGDGRISIESYESAFAEIKQITGQEDLNEIVEKFVRIEDSNFALFNFVNEQNNNIEQTIDRIEQVQDKIKDFKDEGFKLDEDRIAILKDLEMQASQAAVEANENENHLKHVLKILDQLKSGVSSIFKKIGCDNETINDLLGSSDGVKNENMMQYLGLIEQRTNQLLAAQAFADSQDFDKAYDAQESARYLLGQVDIQVAEPLMIAPPSTGDLRQRAKNNKLLATVIGIKDDYDSEDVEAASIDESRPLTHAELKQRIMKGVLKKEAAAAKKGFHYDLTAAKKK